MAELADAHGSGPCEVTHGGSSPFDRTIREHFRFSSKVLFFLCEKARTVVLTGLSVSGYNKGT